MNCKILIVEDEAIVAEDIASRLQKMGYIVVNILASGEAAILAATTTDPDLILMDIRLQGEIDGINAAKQIYQQLKKPIIYLTAYADESTLERAKFAGAFGYVLKPFKERELRATIEIALARHRSEIDIQNALIVAENLRQEALLVSERKTQYIAMASHEFRNPLSNIKAWTQLLQRHEDNWSVEKRQQSLQLIQAAANKLSQLLEDVLILGRAESSQFQAKLIPLDVVSFSQKMLQTHQFSTGKHHLLRFHYHEDCREGYLDQMLLGHLLNNLLSNAIKYSPAGGEVSLTLSCLEREICFQVKDCGIGIPQEDLPRLFQPFQRATNVGNIPGTGLGLAIVKRAVELQNGDIQVESQVGLGTTVRVKLPWRSL